MKSTLTGLVLGLIAGALVYLAERTTGAVHWPLVFGFPICWAVGGYLFHRWDLWPPCGGVGINTKTNKTAWSRPHARV
jgi:hypothetical protein